MTVAALLKHRKQTNSMPLARNDGAKLGLVIEGGGMRGVVSAGMVGALETLGLLQCFDVVYGSSAGAINGAYFLAGQARYGTTIYYQDITNRKFINFGRAVIGSSLVSLEYLLDIVSETIKPLQWNIVLNSRVPLVVVASSMSTGKAVRMSEFADKHDLKESMRASARIPVLAGRTVRHRGMELWDAMVFEDIPLEAALSDNCTHVMALLTHPEGKAKFDLNFFERHAMAALIGVRSISARRTYLKRTHVYSRTISDLLSEKVRFDGREIDALAVQMSPTNSRINGLETRSKVLINGARAGFEAVYKCLGFPRPQVIEVLTAFPPVDYTQ